jgi:hypothetical protein
MRLPVSSLIRSAAPGFLVIVLLAVGGPSEAGGPSRPPAVRLPAPENLTAATRAEVRGRMARHGNTMSNLVRALVLLDRPTIATLAGRIADEEVVSHVEDGGSDELKRLLPKEFFVEQDALQSNARELAASAAHGETDSVMADRFATVAKTCVACHSVYLHGRPGDGR